MVDLQTEIKKVADELVMYEETGVILNRLPDLDVAEYMDLGGLPVLAEILADPSLVEFDLKGENVFYLPDDAAIVQGARKVLESVRLLEG